MARKMGKTSVVLLVDGEMDTWLTESHPSSTYRHI